MPWPGWCTDVKTILRLDRAEWPSKLPGLVSEMGLSRRLVSETLEDEIQGNGSNQLSTMEGSTIPQTAFREEP